MSLESEVFFKQLTKYLNEHQDKICSKKDMEKFVDQFVSEYNSRVQPANASCIPETADDYLMLARDAMSKKQELEYVNKALKLEPDNLDAAVMKAELTAKNQEELLMTLQALIKKGTKQMEMGGYFQDKRTIWYELETRPYMRLRYYYMDTLASNNMMKKARAEGEELLKLCPDDNMGVRFDLMHLYAYFEDEQAALALCEKYRKGLGTQMLLPMAVLYYKLGDLKRSLSYLRRLCKANSDAKRFIVAVATYNLEEFTDQSYPDSYIVGSMSELLREYMNFAYLFEPLDNFFDWSYRTLKK